MLIATLAALCWMGVVATDPSASTGTQHPSEIQQLQTFPHVRPARVAFQGSLIAAPGEEEPECCSGLDWLGDWLLSAICPSCECDEAIGDLVQVDGVHLSGSCAAGCSTTVAGELLQATCGVGEQRIRVWQACPPDAVSCQQPTTLTADGIQVFQVCPQLSTSAIRITGAPAARRACPQACEATMSLTSQACAPCPSCAEGTCHVREFAFTTVHPQPQVLHVFTAPCEPMASHETPWVHGYFQPNVVYTAPGANHPIWIAAHAQSPGPWGPQPPQPVNPQDRILHLQEAARHLEAAGMHAEAHALRQQADEMQHHARRLLEAKEAQLQQLQREIDELRIVAVGGPSQLMVTIPAVLFRVSPEGQAAIREHCRSFGCWTVNRDEFRLFIEHLAADGHAEILADPSFTTIVGREVSGVCGLSPRDSHVQFDETVCDISFRPILHDGCCRMELQPLLRTETAAGFRMQSAQLSAELDPSQGLVAELSDDGSLLAFITWELAVPPQPTAAAPIPVTTERALVPASAELWHSGTVVPQCNAPAAGQLMVTPVFPQPFPARVPQHPQGLQGHQVPPPPAPPTAFPPPTSAPR